MTDDLFAAWLAMEEPALDGLLRDIPHLADAAWTPAALPVLEAAALRQLPHPDAEQTEEDMVLWRRVMRGIGRVYCTTLGAEWVCVPILLPEGGSRWAPVLDVPGLPVWIEVGDLLDRALVERTGDVLVRAFHAATPRSA